MLGNFPTKEYFRQMNQFSLKSVARNGSAASPNVNNNTFSGVPRFLDSESGHGIWGSNSNVERYMSHFVPEEPKPETEPPEYNNHASYVITSRKTSPNYYSDMNTQDRDENLKSLISYCKNSSAPTS